MNDQLTLDLDKPTPEQIARRKQRFQERLAAIGFGQRSWFRAREVALVCYGMSKSHVYALVEEGKLDAVINIGGSDAKKPTFRFPRESVEQFWITNSI